MPALSTAQRTNTAKSAGGYTNTADFLGRVSFRTAGNLCGKSSGTKRDGIESCRGKRTRVTTSGVTSEEMRSGVIGISALAMSLSVR